MSSIHGCLRATESYGQDTYGIIYYIIQGLWTIYRKLFPVVSAMTEGTALLSLPPCSSNTVRITSLTCISTRPTSILNQLSQNYQQTYFEQSYLTFSQNRLQSIHTSSSASSTMGMVSSKKQHISTSTALYSRMLYQTDCNASNIQHCCGQQTANSIPLSIRNQLVRTLGIQ